MHVDEEQSRQPAAAHPSRAQRLIDRLRTKGNEAAIICGAETVSYAEIASAVDVWERRLDGLLEGDTGDALVVAIVSDFSPLSASLLLALFARRCVVVPLSPATHALNPDFCETARVDRVITIAKSGDWNCERREANDGHPLYSELRNRACPGLVLFTSGSTGKSKAALLDADRLLEKFDRPRPVKRTLAFLLFDHIGGVNTLLAVLSGGGTLIVPEGRDVDLVCRALVAHRVEVLPTSPTFLRLLLMADAQKRYDLSSLKLITYGTEPMQEATLRAAHAALPSVQFKQTYGLTELGIFATKSKADDSLWVRVGGDGVETKIVDGILHVRTRAAMVGYLNAPSPFDAEGWYSTGDLVEVGEDGYLLLRGRTSEIINVGGEKVFPAEVESVLMQMPGVRDATVFGRNNAVMGQVVMASVVLDAPKDPTFSRRARAHCAEHLAPYKVPVAFEILEEAVYLGRFKKMRRSLADAAK
ncbi:MAG: fatty acid--CoA ligase family protein [Polyangiales bacterium]